MASSVIKTDDGSFISPYYDPGELAQALIKGGMSSSPAFDASHGSNADELAKQYGVYNSGGNSAYQKYQGKARQDAIAPAVQSLQASIPETQQKFATERSRLEGEKQPLQERYKTLLDELKNKESQQVGAAQTASAREFGKRGVPLSSGAYDQYLAGQVNPIQQNFSTLSTQTVQGREDALRNIQNMISGLVPQETEATRTIQNTIAQLQAGAGNSAIEDAFRQLQMAEQQRQFDTSTGLQREQLAADQRARDISNQLAQSQFGLQQRQFNEITLPTSQYALNKPYYKPTTGGGNSSLPDLNQIFG